MNSVAGTSTDGAINSIDSIVTSVTPQQIEQWILQSNDPTNRSLQHHATQSLQQYTTVHSTTMATINGSIHMARITDVFFHVLYQTSNPISQFYVLSTLQRQPYFAALTVNQRVQLRTFLLETVTGSVSSSPITTTTTTPTTATPTPTFIRNKAAAILSTFLIQDTSIHVMNSTGDYCGSGNQSQQQQQRNWCSVTNDLLSLAQQNPEFYLQTLIYVLDDIMMSTTLSDVSQRENNDNYSSSTSSSSHNSVVTGEDIRQFKDILKGYNASGCDDDGSNQQSNSLSVHNTSTTLLQFLFELTIQIYNSTFHNSNTPNHHGEDERPQDEIILLLCIKAIANVFTWTTMEFLGSSAVLSQMFQLTFLTVQKYMAAPYSSLRFDILKATFIGWKEFVTSCNMSPPQSLSKPHCDTELASSLQSLSDPKLPIICHIVDCINATQLLPVCDTVKCSAVTAPSSSVPLIPYLAEMSPDNTDETSVSSDVMEIIIQMSTLINTIGLEIIPLYEREVLASNRTTSTGTEPTKSILETLFQQVFDLSNRAFAYDDIDVSTEILPYIIRLSYYMEEENRNGTSNSNVAQSMIHQLPFILNILYHQMKYPIDFSFGHGEHEIDIDDDDEVAEEIVFRTELCHVYKKLILAAPSVCLRFVSEAFYSVAPKLPVPNIAISVDLASVPTPDIEAILRLIYVFCEAIRPSPGLKVVMQNEYFWNILQTLHRSNIVQHPHREVLCLYYETAVRYYPFYLTSGQNDLLSKLLNAMSSASGLQHSHPHVRSRCCYLFLRLVQVTITLLTPYVEIAVAGILSLLTNPRLEIRGDDTMYLFETIGLLLGKTGLEATVQQQYLTAVISPHVQNIERTLSTINQNHTLSPNLLESESDDTLTKNCAILSSSIAAITSLSKGFPKPSHETAIVLAETLHITLKVLQILPSSEHIRNKSMVLLQRMIVCVGENILVLIPSFLQILVDWSTCDDVLFVAQIFNQLCIKFKQNAIPAIDTTLLPFLQKCQTLMPILQDDVTGTIGTPLPPHFETEQLAIRKLSYIVLQHIVTHQVTGVLFSVTNVSHLETVLRLMHDGIINASDPIAKKTCLRFFRALIEQIKTVPATNDLTNETNISRSYAQGILSFVGETVLPNTFQMVMKSPNRQQYINDANGVRVITEFSQLIRTFRTACGTEMGNEVLYQKSMDEAMHVLLPYSQNMYTLQQQLQQANNANDFSLCLQNLIKESVKK